MLRWLRGLPHDVIHRKGSSSSNTGRRTSSSTSWRNKSFTARIIRCASTIVHARQPDGDDDDDYTQAQEDDDASSSSPETPTSHYSNHTVVSARAFSFHDLDAATGNFSQDNLLGEGGFGRVYKARLQLIPQQEVAVKQLDRSGAQGNREFVVEVLMLSLLHHPNLVRLVGYCADGDQRLLVYPLMPLGSLEGHLLLRQRQEDDDRQIKNKKAPLSWRTRMKIAHGAARGLEYLHDRDVIYRDLKSSNILLDDDYNPRLSDFGLARLLPAPCTDSSSSSSASSSSRVMGTFGYCAPEYLRTGQLSAKSDVYSFGVLLLELITGRRAIDTGRPDGEQSLVAWAAPMFGDPKRSHELVDPRLVMAMQGPAAAELNQALGVAGMCLQEHHALRPAMTDVVMALSFLATDDSSCC